MCHQQPNTPQAEAHSYTQGCRLHNTSASWNGSQYYWLTQDTGSSQRSSRKAPVPSLLASVFICLSFKPIAQQAASDFSQIFILLDRRDTKSITHTQSKVSARKRNTQPLCYTCGTRTSQAFHSHAIRWTRRIPSHMQELTRNFQRAHVTRNVKNNLKRCEIGVVSR